MPYKILTLFCVNRIFIGQRYTIQVQLTTNRIDTRKEPDDNTGYKLRSKYVGARKYHCLPGSSTSLALTYLLTAYANAKASDISLSSHVVDDCLELYGIYYRCDIG